MGAKTGIQWTDATWNPVTGCTRVSPGCDHCYAERLARYRLRDSYLRRPPAVDTPENRADPFSIRLWPDRLRQPIEWQAPRMVFVNSMSDLFHRDVPESYVVKVFEVMLRADRHIYQVLTKRPTRALRFWRRNYEALGTTEIPSHIWIGTSVESAHYSYRVRQLAALRAAVRFLSCEPLLGPMTLDLRAVHWVIVGGESGPGFRPIDISWAAGIRDQCVAAGVPFFFKQVGGLTPKARGRLLDAREWNEMPAVAAAMA